MKLSRSSFAIALATIAVMALSLGLSFAHLMEAPPRLTNWPPELWRETTVFHGQYVMFGLFGGPIDVGAIVLGFILSFAIGRSDRPSFWLALAAAGLFLLSLAAWLTIVAPANAELATWTPGPLPDNFQMVQRRWEGGHIGIALLKFVGFLMAVSAILLMRRAR